jgi:excisionase family DNA binding protein
MVGMDERMAYRRREAADILGVGPTKLDGLIAAGKIRAVKSGKVLLVPREALRQYLESLPAAVIKDHSNNLSQRARAAAAANS